MKTKCVMMARALMALASCSPVQVMVADSDALRRAWAIMWHVNLRRAQILLGAAITLLDLEKKNEKLEELIGYEREMRNYTEDMPITQGMLNEFDELQYKMTWGYVYVFELLSTKYPDLKSREFFKDEPKPYMDKFIKQALEVDVVADRAKVNFDNAYRQYIQA